MFQAGSACILFIIIISNVMKTHNWFWDFYMQRQPKICNHGHWDTYIVSVEEIRRRKMKEYLSSICNFPFSGIFFHSKFHALILFLSKKLNEKWRDFWHLNSLLTKYILEQGRIPEAGNFFKVVSYFGYIHG